MARLSAFDVTVDGGSDDGMDGAGAAAPVEATIGAFTWAADDAPAGGTLAFAPTAGAGTTFGETSLAGAAAGATSVEAAFGVIAPGATADAPAGDAIRPGAAGSAVAAFVTMTPGAATPIEATPGTAAAARGAGDARPARRPMPVPRPCVARQPMR
ncbi:unnamed protein product [Burkholderia pseudomallei]|nr:unnamed protein product [Burkholderia pseudomallei]